MNALRNIEAKRVFQVLNSAIASLDVLLKISSQAVVESHDFALNHPDVHVNIVAIQRLSDQYDHLESLSNHRSNTRDMREKSKELRNLVKNVCRKLTVDTQTFERIFELDQEDDLGTHAGLVQFKQTIADLKELLLLRISKTNSVGVENSEEIIQDILLQESKITEEIKQLKLRLNNLRETNNVKKKKKNYILNNLTNEINTIQRQFEKQMNNIKEHNNFEKQNHYNNFEEKSFLIEEQLTQLKVGLKDLKELNRTKEHELVSLKNSKQAKVQTRIDSYDNDMFEKRLIYDNLLKEKEEIDAETERLQAYFKEIDEEREKERKRIEEELEREREERRIKRIVTIQSLWRGRQWRKANAKVITKMKQRATKRADEMKRKSKSRNRRR
ncbi:hypothetical protein PCE1_002355 [Barthelona sp. PCE]